MTGHFSERMRWVIVMAFASAMAWVEAASVFYIRALVGRIEPYQADPLPLAAMRGALGTVELWREASTLVMIATVGLLAGRTWRRRAGYAALAFGAWDILYYVFLRLISGWPRTLFDWDILFLLPLPWWGPVLAPVSIALVMIIWGTLATQSNDAAKGTRWTWMLGCAGVALALAVFMIDAWRALPDGREAVLQVLPATFNWPVFCVAVLLMASPALHQIVFGPTKTFLFRYHEGHRRDRTRDVSSGRPPGSNRAPAAFTLHVEAGVPAVARSVLRNLRPDDDGLCESRPDSRRSFFGGS
jgi:hypothetical protein